MFKRSLFVLIVVLCVWPLAYVRAAKYVDIVFIVDESGSMYGEHQWLINMVTDFENQLINSGVGNGTNPNRYALVGFGTVLHDSNEQAHKHLLNGNDWGSASDLASYANLVTDGITEDGWEAIMFALNNYTFRPGAGINLVLVTDEDRDDNDDPYNYNYGTVLNALKNKNAILNVIVDAYFEDGNGNTALGIDYNGTAYIADGSGGYNTSSGGIVTWGDGTTITDYVNLALATGGAAWSIDQLRTGGLTVDSFTDAFIDLKIVEIQQQQPQPIPEPSTFLLVGSGIFGLVYRRLSRKK